MNNDRSRTSYTCSSYLNTDDKSCTICLRVFGMNVCGINVCSINDRKDRLFNPTDTTSITSNKIHVRNMGQALNKNEHRFFVKGPKYILKREY